MAHSDIERQALDACENEPIRTPASIQRHGFMCVCDVHFTKVTYVTRNAKDFIGRSAEDALGKPLNTVFTRDFCHALRNAASLRTIEVQREYLGEFDLGAGDVDAACHRRGSHFIVELTKSGNAQLNLDINRLRWLFPRWDMEGHALDDALDILVHDLRMLTKFSRVMAYRFRPDGSGEVIAESLAPHTESYLGLRFPKWDIPQSARAMSLEQPLRFIGDVAAEDVPLSTSPDNSEQVDMTLAELRGTSPVHKEYLVNMGVRSSLVIPVVIRGELWGMFSLHHSAPRQFTIRETLSIELVGKMLTSHLRSIIERDFQRNTERLEEFVPKIVNYLPTPSGKHLSKDGWEFAAGELCSLLSLDGIALEWGEEVAEYGIAPARNNKFFEANLQPLNSSISLTDELEDKNISGAMRIGIGESGHSTLWLYRKEENQTVRWAGAPKKDIDAEAVLPRLLPRSSFLAYVDESRGKSRAWEPEELEIVLALQAKLASEFEQQFQRRENIEEATSLSKVHHMQTRQLLSFTQSMIGWTNRGNQQSVDEYATVLKKRLFGIVEFFKSAVRDDSAGVSVRASLQAAFSDIEKEKILLNGQTAVMRTDAAVILVCALKEFATATSHRSGFDIEWAVDDEALKLRIFEFGVNLNDNAGYLENAILRGSIHDHLGGSVFQNVTEDGLEVVISIPSSNILIDKKEYREARSIDSDDAELFSPANKNVLVLEDNYLIGVHMRSMIRSLGDVSVSLVLNNESARRELAAKDFDFAFLDVRLKQGSCEETAKTLLENGIDFAFVTGYEESDEWLRQFPTVPIVRKPLKTEQISNYIMPFLSGRRIDEPLTVLLVEDNIPLQEQLCQEILELGHRVERASNVLEAETILDNVQIDALILDIFIDVGQNVSKEGTLRIVSRIRHEMNNKYRVGKDVPILVISGALEVPGGFSPLKMAAQVGATECMAKPLDLNKIRAWIMDIELSSSDQKNSSQWY